jgi:hypothetical protein
MSKRLSFTKAQINRLITAAREAGLRVTGVAVRPDGTIVVQQDEAPLVPSPVEALDKWLNVKV